MKKINIGIVGATGMVGKSFLALMEERKTPVKELRLFASDASVGKEMNYGGHTWKVRGLNTDCFNGLDLVFFSSGDDISKEWAPIAMASGAFAVDNSAAFRMDPKFPLVVPEVNGHLLDQLKNNPTIIANPNCSTIQLVVALKPLADEFGIEKVQVSSYQAVSGAGQAAYDELIDQTKSILQKTDIIRPKDSVAQKFSDPTVQTKNFPAQIAFNCIPQIGSFNAQGFSSEEWKIIHETKKIMGLPELKVSAFTVRVPVLNAHAESVWVRLNKVVSDEQMMAAIGRGKGLISMKSSYPMQMDSSGQNEVFVGRIHRDLDDPQTWLMWVVADNIRKGAATNGLQIAEFLFNS
jgi:aspartate-semialdehyde dehydrogenase